MTVSTWSTTASSNATADPTINFAENQNPSTVNNSARALMAAVRAWYEDVEFRDFGHTVTRTGNTTFTIGSDVTTTYVANRPIRCADSVTLYGVVASSSFSSPNTTVTVTLDSGNLSASLTAVALGPTPTNLPISVQSIRNGATALLAGANAWTGNQTHAGTETFNGAATFNSTTSVASTDAGAGVGPSVVLDRNSASPANSDFLGSVDFIGRDAGGGTDTYARITSQITDTTAASEDASLILQRAVAGTLTTALTISATAINAAPGMEFQVNGSPVGTSASNGCSLVLISSTTLGSDTATIAVPSCFSSTYDEYEISIVDGAVDTNDALASLQITTDNGSTYKSTNEYDWELDYRTQAGASGIVGAQDTTGILITVTGVAGISTTAGAHLSGDLYFKNPASSTLWKHITGEINYDANGGASFGLVVDARYQATTAMTGFRLLLNGTAKYKTGATVYVRGIKKS